MPRIGLPHDWLNIKNHLAVPFLAFSKHPIILPGWVYFIFALITVVAMSNGVNLTDGADGLAIGPVIMALYQDPEGNTIGGERLTTPSTGDICECTTT